MSKGSRKGNGGMRDEAYHEIKGFGGSEESVL